MRLHTLDRRVLKTIQEHALIPPDSTVVVAVSGGVDSMALMHMLHALAPKLRCTLHIATVDHMLRGDESAADAQFVADEAAKLGLACTIRQFDVKKQIARHKKHSGIKPSIEMEARFGRYTALSGIAHGKQARHVVTAHHLNDQAETVLMRLLSGTSLRGLAAMQLEDALPYWGDIRLIRPLLNTSRGEIEAYAAERDIPYREDPSNQNVVHKRNALRHEILPLLRQLNPQVDKALAQLSEQAALESEYFDRQLEAAISSVVVNVPGMVDIHTDYTSQSYIKLHRDSFRALEPALQRRLVMWSYAEYRRPMQGLEGGLTYHHVLTCVDAIINAQVGKRIRLPHDLDLRIDYQYAILEDEDHPANVVVYPTPPKANWVDTLTLETRSFVSHADWLVIARRSETEIAEFTPAWNYRVNPQPRATAALLVPRSAALLLRGRRDGDRFAPPGLDGHTQKIKQWMIDRKIPAAIRDRIPLIDVDGQIAAIFWDEKWVVAEPFRANRTPKESEHKIIVALYT
jgi:tRNA(Ile)-lysidine synthase